MSDIPPITKLFLNKEQTEELYLKPIIVSSIDENKLAILKVTKEFRNWLVGKSIYQKCTVQSLWDLDNFEEWKIHHFITKDENTVNTRNHTVYFLDIPYEKSAGPGPDEKESEEYTGKETSPSGIDEVELFNRPGFLEWLTIKSVLTEQEIWQLQNWTNYQRWLTQLPRMVEGKTKYYPTPEEEEKAKNDPRFDQAGIHQINTIRPTNIVVSIPEKE